MDSHNAIPLPAMSYITVEPKPIRPTEAQIRRRAHHLWVMRDGAPGNAALDWLQAEWELTGELAQRAACPDRLIEPRDVPRDVPLEVPCGILAREGATKAGEHASGVEVECKPDLDHEQPVRSERLADPHGPARARRAA